MREMRQTYLEYLYRKRKENANTHTHTRHFYREKFTKKVKRKIYFQVKSI